MKDDELAESASQCQQLLEMENDIDASRKVQNFRSEIVAIFCVTACVLRRQKKGSLMVR